MAHLVQTTGALRPRPIGWSSAELLTVTTRVAPSGALVVAVRGDVDPATCPLLRARLIAQLRTTHHLVLDLGEVRFLSAAGLTVLLVVREAALMAGSRLCVVARSRLVRLPLMITGLSGVLDLHLDVADALLCPSLPAGPRLVDPRQPGDLR